MAVISQGVVSLAGTPADRRRALARVARLKPHEVVLCHHPAARQSGWYAVESGSLASGLKQAKLGGALSPQQQAHWLGQHGASVKAVKVHAPSLAAQIARRKIGAGRKWSPIDLDVLLDDERELKLKLSSRELKSFLAKVPLSFGGKTFYARPASVRPGPGKSSIVFRPQKKGAGFGFVVTQPANATQAIAKLAAPSFRRPAPAREAIQTRPAKAFGLGLVRIAIADLLQR